MNLKTNLTIASLLMTLLILPVAGTSQERQPEDLKILYGRLIDDVITRCNSKQLFKDTRSENVRKAVALSVMKGAFLQTYREALVQELFEGQVRPTPVTVQFFLNNRFHALMN
jgi:hypothetical protein